MQNVRNRLLTIETNCFGIKLWVSEKVLWRFWKIRQSRTQIAAQAGVVRCFWTIYDTMFVFGGLGVQQSLFWNWHQGFQKIPSLGSIGIALSSRFLVNLFKKSSQIRTHNLYKRVFSYVQQTLRCVKLEFLDVCMTNSGNSQGEIDFRHSIYIPRHIPRSVVHGKTAFCIDFV